MREIIIITEWYGHTIPYAKLIWPYFLNNGIKIYHITNRPEEARRYFESELPQYSSNIDNIRLESVISPQKSNNRCNLAEIESYWLGLGITLRNLEQRLGRMPGIFHTWIDLKSHPFLKSEVISDAIPGPCVGLCIHPVEYRIFKSWKRRLYEGIGNLWTYGQFKESRIRSLNISKLCSLYLLDEMVVPSVVRDLKPNIKVRVFPEPVDSTINEVDIPRLRYLKKQGCRVLTVVGFLHKRKGILNLIRTAYKKPNKWAFLFAGPLDLESLNVTELQEVNEWLQNLPENCVGYLSSLEDSQVNSIIRQSDIIYLAYEDFFHSSNIQIKASLFKKPIIAGPRHLISERTRKHRLGWCLDDHKPDTLLKLLNGLDEVAIKNKTYEADYKSLTAEHSIVRLNQCLAEITSELGI